MGCGQSKPLSLPSATSKPVELREKRGEQLAPEKQPVSKPNLDDGNRFFDDTKALYTSFSKQTL